jgi:hypothetical protein
MNKKGICDNCGDITNLQHGICIECLNVDLPPDEIYVKQNPIETVESHQIGAKWIGKDSKVK